ncbi:hypothetical protein L2E82_48114 [Cichorium intybus]|uniref:Uncharacterized protein n=1 Tax=Cichorium intybus TaxID=13427 RepID=A0ACB8YXM4_CICIN|nr:hypothetical protein L2E82_48114 [Cichorium intybus]
MGVPMVIWLGMTRKRYEMLRWGKGLVTDVSSNDSIAKINFKMPPLYSHSDVYRSKHKIMKTRLERLSSLKKLEVLDLGSNDAIDNDILPLLTTLTSLKILDLRRTSLNGNFRISDFAALENLEMLDLTHCGFNGAFEIEGSDRVSLLWKLKTLNLRYNKFNESVITSLNTLTSLTNLDLRGNYFTEPFSVQV